jgi:hypothetical protein
MLWTSAVDSRSSAGVSLREGTAVFRVGPDAADVSRGGIGLLMDKIAYFRSELRP